MTDSSWANARIAFLRHHPGGVGPRRILALPLVAKGLGKPGVKLRRQEAVPGGKALAFPGRMLKDLPTGHLSHRQSALSSSNHGLLAAKSSSSQPPTPGGPQSSGSSVHSDSHCRHNARCASVSGGGRPGLGSGVEGLQGLCTPSIGLGSGSVCRAWMSCSRG